MEKLISAIPKNQREELRVALSEFARCTTWFRRGFTTTPARAR